MNKFPEPFFPDPFSNPKQRTKTPEDGVIWTPDNYDFIQLGARALKVVNRIIANCDQRDCGYDTPCWCWLGADSGIGSGDSYGRVSIDGYTSAVHRVMYACFNGYVHPKRNIDHKCNTRICCRPSHLQSVTARRNQQLKWDRING